MELTMITKNSRKFLKILYCENHLFLDFKLTIEILGKQYSRFDYKRTMKEEIGITDVPNNDDYILDGRKQN